MPATSESRAAALRCLLASGSSPVAPGLNPLLRGWVGYFGLSQLRELPSLGWVGDAFAAPPGSNAASGVLQSPAFVASGWSPWQTLVRPNPPNRRVWTRMPGGGGVARPPPIPIDASTAVDHRWDCTLPGYSGATTGTRICYGSWMDFPGQISDSGAAV